MASYLIVSIALLIGLAFFEFVAHKTAIPRWVMRKAVHVAMAILVIIFSLVFSPHIFVYIGLLFGIVMIAFRLLRPLASLSDRYEQSFGEIFFPFGIMLAALICPETIGFIAAIGILGFSDTAAYFAGTYLRSKKLLFGKTLSGSTAFALVTFMLCVPVIPLPLAVLATLSLTIIEMASLRGADNLTIPVVAAVFFAFA